MFLKLIKADIELAPEKPFRIVSAPKRPCPYFFCDMHYALQVCIVTEGEQEIIYPDSNAYVRKLKKGQVYCCSCWEPHGGKNPDAHSEIVAISFYLEYLVRNLSIDGTELLAPFLVSPMNRPFADPPESRKKVLAIVEEIITLEKEKPFACMTLQWLKIHELLILIQEGWHLKENLKNISSIGRIMPAIELINTCEDKILSLEEAASGCGLSRSRFSKLFTETMGISFHKFYRRSKMTKAKNLLLNSELQVKEIAIMCGFGSPISFNRAFRDYFLCTPQEIRFINSSDKI